MKKENVKSLEIEFRNLCLRFKKLKNRSGRKRSKIIKLKKRLKYLYRFLLPKYGKSNLLRVPGAALFCLSMMTSSQATGQSFEPHVNNPFGFEQLNIENAERATLVDLDNDGDFDLMTVEFYEGYVYYENIGSEELPVYANSQFNPFGMELNENHGYAVPYFADMDNDGDLDLIVSEHDDLLYSENIGTAESPSFGPQESNSFGISTNTYIDMAIADWDNDGDLDFLGSIYENTIYYENIGTVEQASFAQVAINPFNLPPTNYVQFCATDIDNDGDLDLITSDTYFAGNAISNFKYYENSGNVESPNFEAVVDNPFGLEYVEQVLSAFTCADLDNDGDIDVLTTEFSYLSGEKFVRFYENVTTISSTSSLLPDDIEVKVFPTVTDDLISIQSNYPIISLQVIDSSGKLIMADETPASVVSLNTLSSGIYTLKFLYQEGYVIKRIVKQ